MFTCEDIDEGCKDPIYEEPIVIPPLPEDDCNCSGGGSGEGHKYTFRATATGWQVLEDGKPIYSYTDKDTNTTYTWQATAEGWLVKDNTGKTIFTYTDKSGENTTYNFEKKDDCGFKVTDNEGKVVFDYDNDCAGTTYTYEQTGVDFKVTDNKTGKVVFTYKGTVDTNTTYTWEDYKDGFKVTDSDGVVAYIYDPNLGKDSDGSYAIDTLLTTVFKGHTTISLGQIISFDPADLVVGETLVYDGVGSVGVITKDNGNGTYQVTTMTTSPGSRQGVRLGSVNTVADLPATCAAAEAMGWQTPQLGDFAYVTTGGAGDVVSEYVITTDTDCNLTWTFSHSFNAGDYQAQSTTSMSGMILTGGAVQGTFGTPIDPSTLIRGVKRNGILLTPDAQGKVNVIVDDSHIIVNALPTTGIVDKAEYVVIDANQKVTGTWVHDATGWYQTYAAVNQVKAHQVVLALPTTGIEENVEYVVVDNANKVTGTWVYDPAKGWLQTEKLEKAAHIVVKTLPTTDIDDEAEYVVVDDLTDPVNTFKATYVHTASGWVKTGESMSATAAHIAVTALPTTNINENAEYLVMTDTSDPSTLTGTWVRVNGNWVQTEKMEEGYHIVTALPTTDIDEDNTYIVVTDLAKPDDTFQGQYAYDKATNKWINLASDKTVYYNVNRDGQELASWAGSYAEQSISPSGTVIDAKAVEYSKAGPGNVIKFDPTTSIWTFQGGEYGRRFEMIGNTSVNGVSNHADASTKATQVYQNFYNADTNAAITPAFGQFNDPSQSSGFGGGGTAVIQFDVAAGTELKVKVRMSGYTSESGKKVWIRTGSSSITIKEIGRIVDPVAYLNGDGNAEDTPVGNIISYMGNDVPKHYLECDGTLYTIGEYPALEAHIVEQFGTINHFGGNGTTTWAVPDLRGEFLRGTGENATTGYEGEDVGAHQDGTTLLGMYASSNNGGIYTGHGNMTDGSTFDNYVPNTGKTAVNSRTSIENNAYGSVIGTGRARPTNTSVKYCIKYETVPKVVIEAAAYNCSIAASYPATTDSSTGVVWQFDHNDIIGNASMVSGNTFVAPIDGMYAVGAQFSTRGEGNISVYMELNGQSIDWNIGMHSSSLLQLKAGDTVLFRSIAYKGVTVTANSGRVNIALVQVADEKRTAELMLKPNLWTPGVEQSFGDGVYGIRFVGTVGRNTNTKVLDVADPASFRFINTGGACKRSDGWHTYGGAETTMPYWWVQDSAKALHVWGSSTQTTQIDYWALYTK